MLKFAAIIGALSLISITPSNAGQTPALYVPVGVYYLNGKLNNVIAYPQQSFDSLKECTESMQRAILALKQSGKVPAGGDVLGTCLPVPITVGTVPAAPATPINKGTAREPVSNL